MSKNTNTIFWSGIRIKSKLNIEEHLHVVSLEHLSYPSNLHSYTKTQI